jgi:D-glycero-alpha-D-manno-heptose-7-phosphate kinase
MPVFEATAPTRIDLAGGTLDIWPLYLFHPGAITLNVAIDRRALCRVRAGGEGVSIRSLDTGARHEARHVSEILAQAAPPLAAFVLQALGIEQGIEMSTQSRVPAGSGLGGSSALAVAIAAATAAAFGRAQAPEAIWPLTRDAEARCLGVPAGIQDYLPAIYGGALAIHLEAGGVRLESLALDFERVEQHLLLVDAGGTRFSGLNNWEIFKARIDGDTRVRAALDAIASVAVRMRAALVAGRYEDVVALVAQEWATRKLLTPAITTPEIDRLVAIAEAAGGAGKACGAGGGGMVALWARGGEKASLEQALRGAGFSAAAFRIERSGLRVERST